LAIFIAFFRRFFFRVGRRSSAVSKRETKSSTQRRVIDSSLPLSLKHQKPRKMETTTTAAAAELESLPLADLLRLARSPPSTSDDSHNADPPTSTFPHRLASLENRIIAELRRAERAEAARDVAERRAADAAQNARRAEAELAEAQAELSIDQLGRGAASSSRLQRLGSGARWMRLLVVMMLREEQVVVEPLPPLPLPPPAPEAPNDNDNNNHLALAIDAASTAATSLLNARITTLELELARERERGDGLERDLLEVKSAALPEAERRAVESGKTAARLAASLAASEAELLALKKQQQQQRSRAPPPSPLAAASAPAAAETTAARDHALSNELRAALDRAAKSEARACRAEAEAAALVLALKVD
jgi:hypothetical protein